MTSPTTTDVDPFAGSDSAPALSFKESTVGTVRTITVTDGAKLVQSRDYETGDLATWPDGNPKMSAVINGTDETGEAVSVWASKPSSLFSAIADAQKAVKAGYRVKPGDVLAIKFDSEKPNAKNPRLNAQKIYKARITPAPEPDAFGGADPWGSSAPAAAQQPAQLGDEPPF